MKLYGPPSENQHAFYKVFPKNFRVRESIGDGSCFFHSLASAITKDYDQLSRNHQRVAGLHLRQKFKDLMNEQLYHNTIASIKKKLKKRGMDALLTNIDSWDQFDKKMDNTRTWADLIIISVVGIRLNMNILFWDSVGKCLYYGVDNIDHIQKGWPTILVEWEKRSHFNLIVKQNTTKDSVVTQRQFFWAEDSAFLKKLIKQYHLYGKQ